MPARTAALVAVSLMLIGGCSSGAPKKGTLGLRTVTDIPLPGDTSRFDYVSLDASRSRLYVSHLGASQVVVVNTQSNTLERTLDNIPSVHGVVVMPGANRVFAAATGSDQLVTYDATTLTELTRASTGRAPDGLAYDPDTNAVFVSNESGTTVTEVDATTGKTRGDIDIGGEAGNVNYDSTSKHVLVDVQTRNDVAVIDATQRRVIERHTVPGCDHDHGLQVDSDHHRAFVACDGNARLYELDLTTFAVTASFQTGDEPDVLTLDARNNRLYVLAESGVATIIDTSTVPAALRARDTLADNAHSGTVDQDTHRLYVPLADVNGHPALRVLDPTS